MLTLLNLSPLTLSLLSPCILLCLILPILLSIINLFFQTNFYSDREKSSPYECGFDPINNARIPFSLRFFILAVLFLVFDIEIVILLPLPISSNFFNFSYYIIPSSILISILILGLIHE